MSANFLPERSDPAPYSLLLTRHALVRWQRLAGDYWPYVCAAPFLGDVTVARPSVDPSRVGPARLPRTLSEAFAALPADAGSAVFVDLSPTTTIPATPALNRLGFVVVPIIQRWVAVPAVLPCGLLARQLVRYSQAGWRPRPPSGVVFLLDGDRAGPRGLVYPARRSFDNRYAYPSDRFPPPDFLLANGVTRVFMIANGELAPDLVPYVRTLTEAGFRVAGLPPFDLAVPVHGEGDGEVGPARGLTGAFTTSTGQNCQPEPRRRISILTLPGVPPPALYRRFVRKAQLSALLADHLVRGEPYLALNALVLDPADDALLRQLTETFASAFQRAGRVLAAEVPVLEEMGFPWVAAELLSSERPRLPLVGRFDFVRDDVGHWWLLEFNADTPSGIREAIAVEGVLCALRREARGLVRPSLGLRDALVAAFVEAVRDLPSGGALGLVTNAGELEDLAQMAYTRDLLTEPLAALGRSVVLGDVDNLRRTPSGLSLGGQRLGALYRYVAFETTFGTPAFAALYDAVAAGQVRLLNGLFGLLLQHKGVLAWLWSHREDPGFTSAEQVAIREHLPETEGVGDWVSGEGVRSSPPVVVKQVFGREGEEVFFGEELTDADWERFRQQGTYVVQRRIAIEPIEAIVPTSLGARLVTGHATVGSYAVAGKWGGYYTRFGGKIITSQAKWLATLVGGQGER